jgi:hypothetical protein
MTGWWQEPETDIEAVNCADANERQADSITKDPWRRQRVADMNPPPADPGLHAHRRADRIHWLCTPSFGVDGR